MHQRLEDRTPEHEGQADDHDARRNRHRQHVRRNGDDRQRTEPPQRKRRNCELRGDRCRRHSRNRTRAEHGGKTGCQPDEPRGCGNREHEAHRTHEQRIDDEQYRNGRCESPACGNIATECRCTTGDDHHEGRTHDTWFETRDECEHDDDSDDERNAHTAATGSDERCDPRQYEGDVLPGHRNEVPHARGAKGLYEMHGMIAVVANEQTAQQRSIGGGQTCGHRFDELVHAGNQSVHGSSGLHHRKHLTNDDVGSDVIGDVGAAYRAQRASFTDDVEVLARPTHHDDTAHGTVHGESVAPRPVGNDDTHPSPNRTRIVDETHDIVNRSDRHVVQSPPLHRTVCNDDDYDTRDEKTAAHTSAVPTMFAVTSDRRSPKTSASSPGNGRDTPNGADTPGTTAGLHASRALVQRRGPAYTVGGAAVVGVLGAVMLVAPLGIVGVLGYVLVVAAMPLLSVTGAPLESSLPMIAAGVVASCALWWLVGWWAARQACAAAVVGWREFVRELIPLVVGVVVGAGGALLVAALSLGVL